jgi:hypothetical protein
MKATALFILLAASAAFGQIDSSGLRAKFGEPLNRETFMVRPGVLMIVDYSPTANHACRLELPGQAMPTDAPLGVAINPKKIIDDILAEIVPLSMRGKELGGMSQQMSLQGISTIDYENVSIAGPFTGNRRTALIVRFKTPDCLKLLTDLALLRLL